MINEFPSSNQNALTGVGKEKLNNATTHSFDRNIFRALISVAIFLIVFNVINYLLHEPCWQLTRLFHFDYEANFSTWFSSWMLIVCAFYAYVLSAAHEVSTSEKRLWQIMSLILLFLSCDETAQIHENLSGVMKKCVFIHLSSGRVLYLLMISGVLYFLFVQLRRCFKMATIPIRTKLDILIGYGLYIVGAFVLDALQYLPDIKNWPLIIRIIKGITEESLEILGIILVLKGLMEYKHFLHRRSNHG